MLLRLLHLGRIEYAEALELQQELIALRKQQQIGDVLLLLEHPPVLTLGRNAHLANVLASDAELARRGISVHEIDRGGDVTYHGPGQIVGYPIVDLRGVWCVDPAHRGTHRRLDAARRQHSREEDCRHRRAYFSGNYFVWICLERDHRPAKFSLDRSVRNCGLRRDQPGRRDRRAI
jgi:hypothetical protein